MGAIVVCIVVLVALRNENSPFSVLWQFKCLLGFEPQKNNMLGVVIASSSTCAIE